MELYPDDVSDEILYCLGIYCFGFYFFIFKIVFECSVLS